MRQFMKPIPHRTLVTALAAGLSLVTASSTLAQCVSLLLQDADFEGQHTQALRRPWYPEGSAGIDFGESTSAFARSTTGWNAIRQPVSLRAGVTYTLHAQVRTSGNVRNGYFGFRDAAQHPVREIPFGRLPNYTELSVQYRPAQNGLYFVFTGFWAPGQEAWIQMDHYRLDEIPFSCGDVQLNPAPN